MLNFVVFTVKFFLFHKNQIEIEAFSIDSGNVLRNIEIIVLLYFENDLISVFAKLGINPPLINSEMHFLWMM